jgi:peroxiredoxin
MLLVSACSEQQAKLTAGESTPAFTLETLQGKPSQFPSDYRGKIVAVRFWADWCPFCESEMQALEPVYQNYRERGLRILAVNVRQDRETAADFINDLNISYETLLDREGEVARAYGVMALPTTFFIDRNGVLKTRILGESTPETFEQIILEMLQ